MTVNAADYGMLPSATAAANKTALLAAMNAGLAVRIPGGSYTIDGDIEVRKTNQVIFGDGPADAYNYSYGPTILNFASGTVGFDMQTYFNYTPAVDYGSGMNSEYGALQNLCLDGNGNVDHLIKFKGQKRFKGLHLTNYKSTGIWGVDWLNASVIEDCSIFNYASRGAAWGDANKFVGTAIKLEGGNSTCTFINRVRARCNSIGFLLRGLQGGSVRDSVIESNSNIGMLLEAYDNSGMVRNLFDNLWFENNADYAGDNSLYQLAIRNYSTSSTWRAQHNEFVNCNFSHPATNYQRSALIDANVIGTSFDNSSFASAPIDNGAGTRYRNCIGVPDTIEPGGQGSQPLFNMPAGTTLTITTDGVDANLAALLTLYNANTGMIGVFAVTGYSIVEITDIGGSFAASQGPTADQFNVWSDDSGVIRIKNNWTVARTLSVNIAGATITAMAGPA